MSSSTSLPVPAIKRLIRRTFQQEATVHHISAIPSTSLNVSYLITLSDNTKLTLKIPPPSHSRLLRHEAYSLASELAIYQHLQETNPSVVVPKVIASDLSMETLGTSFFLTTSVQGHPLCDHYPSFTSSRRRALDRQLGSFVLSTRSLVSSTFGPLYPPFPTPSWRLAFTSLLESALRDAEDVLLALPYETIRFSVAHHSPTLDAVREARLVLLNLAVDDPGLICDDEGALVGISGATTAIWGDPRLARVFEDPTTAFYEGLGSHVPKDGVRGLLYTLYRSVVIIVEEYYRPSREKRELEARKKLTSSLTRLAELGN
ncbi:MAG: hypothetical protein M1833_004219 [Piccolia ochrophora]|nr:MAG: hypothetical protein M1833_004219 [Piccolia ochrophora]